MAGTKENKEKLQKRILSLEKTLGVNIDTFLMSNTRRDRDKVIKKREELKTYKSILNEFFQ